MVFLLLPATDDNINTLGDWVKLNRKVKNVSQKELSKASHLSQSLISQIEKGVVHDISVATLFRLLNYFKADINEVSDLIGNSLMMDLECNE